MKTTNKSFFCYFLIALLCTATLIIPEFAAEAFRGEFRSNPAESRLLHVKVDLRAVYRWEGGRITDKVLSSSKPLLVVHLFSLDCRPCLKELPALKHMFYQSIPNVDYVPVLLALDSERIRDFLQANGDKLPPVPLYINTDPFLQSKLGINTVPLTLLLDTQRVIRQAFVGSVLKRKNKLLSSIDLLLSALLNSPISFNSIEGIEPQDLLHRKLKFASTATRSDTNKDHRELQRSAQIQVLYLYGTNCEECQSDVEGPLRIMIRGWSRIHDVGFAIINCRQANLRDGMVQSSWSNPYTYPCQDKYLKELLIHEQSPIILIIDSHQIIRDAFVGLQRYRLAAAIERLLNGRV